MIRGGAVLAIAAAAAGCKASAARQVEAALREHVTAMGLRATRATCPGDVEARPGEVFTCQVAVEARTYAIDVTIKGVDAKDGPSFVAEWHDGPAVDRAKLEVLLAGKIGEALGSAVRLRCGDEPLAFLDDAHRLHCTLAAGEVQAKAILDFDPRSLAPIGWQLDPPLIARAKIEAVLVPAVRAQAPDVTLECGTAAVFARPADGVLTCKATTGGQTGTLRVDIDDSSNVTRWALGPS